MAGAKSGKAPGKIFAPGGSEVFEGSGRDYFTDPHFHREGSLEQSKQQWKDQDQLDTIKAKERAKRGPPGGPGHPVLDLLGYRKGGSVQKHGSSTCVHSRTKG